MNKRNRIAFWLCLVLAALMVVSVMPISAISVAVAELAPSETLGTVPNSAGEISVDTGNPALDDSVPVGNPGEGYTPTGTAISSAEDFDNMEYDGEYYLTADITVNTTYASFAGVFDGNGHTVTISKPLFNAPQNATIKNLIVAGSVAVVSGANTAAVANGTSVDCNFFNILNKANVTTTATSGDQNRASGIAGRTNGYTIFERCTNEGTMTGRGLSAGITALLSADEASEAVLINCVNKGAISGGVGSAGGIVGAAECPLGTMLVYNCRNEGSISSSSAAVGGIVGLTNTNSMKSVEMRIVNCTNAGVVTSGEYYAGGMIGLSNSAITIENCVNETTGKVYAGPESTSNQRQAGGIIGHAADNPVLLTGCTNYADIEGSGQTGGLGGWLQSRNVTVENCKNYGNVTSRLSYAGGIVVRADIGAEYYGCNVLFTDCVNEGKITTFNGNTGGIMGYSQSPATYIRCINRGEITYRADSADGQSLTAGGIAGCHAAGLTMIDCRNEGNIISKASHTLTGDVYTADAGGTAGGLLGSGGNGSNREGVTTLIGCVNTGTVTAGKPLTTGTVAHTCCYAGAMIGYQYGATKSVYAVVTYCVNTGNVVGGSNAGYVLGYTNSTIGYFADNVFAGKLSSMAFPSGTNAKGSSVLNALFWDNASTLGEHCYARNWVVDSFEGPMINNLASTEAGSPVDMSNFSEYRFSEGDDPFAVMSDIVLVDHPRDEAIEISTAAEFMAMEPFGNYKLTADITLTESYAQNFGGKFDGGNHTVTVSGKSVFTIFNAGAEISNLTIAGSAITYGDTVGALARYGAASCKNVHNTVDVTATTNNAGGIIGSTSGNAVRMENCTNTGTIISETNMAGGIMGYVDAGSSYFINCVNEGAVTSKTQHAGGIVGSNQYAYTNYIGCVNTGKITASATSGDKGAGGIQGYNGTSWVVFDDCYNAGEVAGPWAGGIFGDTAKGAKVTGCVNAGKITATVAKGAGGIGNHHADAEMKLLSFTNCVNTGEIGGMGPVGGIVGAVWKMITGYNLKFTSCVNTGTITGTGNTGGIAGHVQMDNSGGKTVMTSCVNAGAVSSTGTSAGGLIGYVWAGADNETTGVEITDCVAAGSVTSTSTRCTAVLGYMNSNMATIKNNVIVAELSSAGNTYLYYGSNASALAAKANIADNLVRTGTAMYDAYRTNGTTPVALGAQSTGTKAMDSFDMDSTLTGTMLLIAGILPERDGRFASAYTPVLAKNEANQVAVYNAENALVATVTSLTDVSGYLTEGATVKLLADYYAALPANIVSDGISYTFDGNGFAIYAADTGKPMLGFSGSGKVNVNNFVMYAQGYALRVGLNRRLTGSLDITFENAKIYAGGMTANGYTRYTSGRAMLVNAPLTTVNLCGANTVLTSSGVSQYVTVQYGAVLNISDGKYETRGWLETYGTEPLVNIYNGTFIGTGTQDALITSGSGVININGGYFENGGMCVARVLGGSTAGEGTADNTIKTETDATLNILGGVLVATLGTDGAHHAVVRCGGGTTYGTVNISGGTMINQKSTSQQVVFKNNTCASLYITGGKLLALSNQVNFIRSNGCVDITAPSGYKPFSTHDTTPIGAYAANCNYAGKEYKVWTMCAATDETLAIETLTGAQVRMTEGSTGLRFISTLTAEKAAAAAALAGEGGTVSYGTVIAPMDFVAYASAFTMEALDAADELASFTSRYVDIPADVGLTVDENGNVEIRAALTNIKTENLTRAFAAVAYVRVETAAGEVTYLYGAFNGTDNVRAIREVAEKALADVSDTQDDVYKYTIYDADGATVVGYSKYSAYQREVLNTFVA